MRHISDPSPPHLRPISAIAPLGGTGFFTYLRAVTFQYSIIMSKSNMLLGLAKGKVGDLVFYRDGGEQRTRTRVIPKNPRSEAQMAQRVRMANVPAFYRVMQAIMKDSFSNRPSNQSGYNAFARGAIEVSPFLTKEMALAGSVLPAPYMVSRGVISSLPYQIATSEKLPSPKISLRAVHGAPSTFGALSQAILSDYPQLQEGDTLTFVSVAFSVGEFGDSLDIYKANAYTYQLVLDSTSNVEIPSNELNVSLDGFAPVFSIDEDNLAVAIVVSRKLADGTLQTSTDALVLNDTAGALYESYRTEQALSAAIESYGRGEDSVLRK